MRVFVLILFSLASIARADIMNLYIGTYTGPSSEGIYRVTFDDATGAFTSEATLVATVKNPSFLAVAPGGKQLYCVSEVGGGAVSAFAIDAHDKPLRHLSDARSGGDGPCHLAVMPGGKTLVVANYGSGHFTAMSLYDDGSIGEGVGVAIGAGGGPVESRQKKPHAHSVVPVPGHDDLLAACDLGSDEVTIFRVKPGSPMEVASRVKSPAGAGPRMSVWSKDGTRLFVADELSNTLSVYALEQAELRLLAQVDVLQAGVSREALFLAHVALSNDGRFAYVSIRDTSKDPQSPRDTIAVVDVTDPARTVVVQHVPCARVPRHFAVLPGGKWLVVAGQKSGTLAVHPIDVKTGRLGEAGAPLQAGIPTCVLAVR